MAPTPPRLKILSVGGNAVSAFLSWRLSATNACDVTLVWKAGYENVAQYGITFKSSSKTLGQERFMPRSVVRTPEEAAQTSRVPFDYVLLCVKALPDIYDLASIIEPVVSPQHTCILVNTTNALGIESYLESRFPTNVVLSLVSGTQLTQTGPSEFEHVGSTDFWVGPANRNPGIPATIQSDMAEALAMTLNSGQVDCKVSTNIRQQQYERMIGPIAFHPTSVLFDTANHAELLEKTGVRGLVVGIIEEMVNIAEVQGCFFPKDYSEQTMDTMITPTDQPSPMFQDYLGRRPLEIETYLGSPLKLAREVGVAVPRLETLYALLHNVNIMNQKRPQMSPNPNMAPPRSSSAAPGAMNGHMAGQGPMRGGMRPGSRVPSMSGGPPGRRGPGPGPGSGPGMGPGPGGFGPGPRGQLPNGRGPPPPPLTRRPSMEGNDLEEFSHLMLYDNMPQDGQDPYYAYGENGAAPPSAMNDDYALRERECALRRRELALREQEMNMRRGPPQQRRVMPPQSNGMYNDMEEGDDFDGDLYGGRSPPVAPIDADNFDMMSVTSRRTRKAPSAQQLRQNPEMMGNGKAKSFWGRPKPQNRASARLMADVGPLHESIMSNSLMGYSSDRYGGVDRHNLQAESRTNSLTAERLNELQQNNGAMLQARRSSAATGQTMSPRPLQRSSQGEFMGGRPGQGEFMGGRPPQGEFIGGRPTQGEFIGGRPTQAGAQMLKSPMANGIMPGQGMISPNGALTLPNGQMIRTDGPYGVSSPNHPLSGKPSPQEQRSLTGSASASAGSADSAHSARLDANPSAHSSASSLGTRPLIGVR